MKAENNSIKEYVSSQNEMISTQQSSRTPLYRAMSDDRYHRQTLIKRIQKMTGRSLICYVSGSDCMIDHNDIVPFVDLLHNLQKDKDVDFLLHTTGGRVDAAEKLIELLKDVVGAAKLRIIVPDYAKSAGTLMVLAADKVVMSDMSELGPIDPQMFIFGRWQSVQNYLDAHNELEDKLKLDSNNVAAKIMLKKLDPTTLKSCEMSVKRARQAAEKLLKRGMFHHNSGNFTKTVDDLLDTKRWLSHSQMISWEDALQLDLKVEYLQYHSKEWQKFWRIYCLQRLVVSEHNKLFESDYASLLIGPSEEK